MDTGHPCNRTLHDAMYANWYGLLTNWFGGEDKRTVESIPLTSRELGGIVGGPQGTFARYGLSEEFTAVYRLHSLLPDSFVVQRGGEAPIEIPLHRTRHAAVKGILREHGLTTLAASMGVQHPGALVNNNFPAALLDISVPGMPVTDLGAVDLYRDRERGVPPYNQLRKELGLPRIPSFDALTEDTDTVATLRRMVRNRRERGRQHRRHGPAHRHALRRAPARGLRLRRAPVPGLHPQRELAAPR